MSHSGDIVWLVKTDDDDDGINVTIFSSQDKSYDYAMNYIADHLAWQDEKLEIFLEVNAIRDAALAFNSHECNPGAYVYIEEVEVK